MPAPFSWRTPASRRVLMTGLSADIPPNLLHFVDSLLNGNISPETCKQGAPE
jgi:hypothetical protein